MALAGSGLVLVTKPPPSGYRRLLLLIYGVGEGTLKKTGQAERVPAYLARSQVLCITQAFLIP